MNNHFRQIVNSTIAAQKFNLLSAGTGDLLGSLTADAVFALKKSPMYVRSVKQAVNRLEQTRKLYESTVGLYVVDKDAFYGLLDRLQDALRGEILQLQSSIKLSLHGEMKHLDSCLVPLLMATFVGECVYVAHEEMLDYLKTLGVTRLPIVAKTSGVWSRLCITLRALPAPYNEAAKAVGGQPAVKQAAKNLVAKAIEIISCEE